MSEFFIGRGWSWPLGVSASGGVAMAEGRAEIEQSIRLILGTEPGERPMRPEFGCAIRDQVFGSFDAATSGAIAQQVWRALERWEPRIVVDDVDVVQSADEQDVLRIHVGYHLAGTNSRRNLVHPFYVIPAHESGPAAGAGEAVDTADSAGAPTDRAALSADRAALSADRAAPRTDPAALRTGRKTGTDDATA